MIAAGYSYLGPKDRVDVVVVGRGDRKHVDELVRLAPELHRTDVIEYFKPMVEGGYPAKKGVYLDRQAPAKMERPAGQPLILWWKRADKVLP